MQLRAHRERVGLTLDQAAVSIDKDERTLRRWEKAQASIRTGDLRALLDLYDVSGSERIELELLAREGRLPGWWTPYTSAVRPTFATFLGLEAEAASIQQYAGILVPGLLQTENYARHTLNVELPTIDDGTVDKRLAVRRKRQTEMFARGYPAHFVIDQGALLRRVGDAGIMREQLDYLTELSKSRLITIQVIPFAAGAYAVLGGFTVLTFDVAPPVAVVELPGGDLYADGPDSVLYTEHFAQLRESALNGTMSMVLVGEIKEGTL